MYVEGVGADGSTSPATAQYFYADGATKPADKDVNGDGVADLLADGDPSGLGSGIWQAFGKPAGTATGRLRTPAVNVGAGGADGAGDTAWYDGSLIFTGDFLGENLQDVMIVPQRELASSNAARLCR